MRGVFQSRVRRGGLMETSHSAFRRFFRGGLDPWTPADLPGVALWLDAGPQWCLDGSGNPCADGTPVATWVSRVGSISFVQATSGFRPVLSLISAGVWRVVFDGIDDIMTFSGTFPQPNGSGHWSAIGVGRLTNGTHQIVSRWGGLTPQWRIYNQAASFRTMQWTGSANVTASVAGTFAALAVQSGGYDGTNTWAKNGRGARVNSATAAPLATSAEIVELGSTTSGFSPLAAGLNGVIWATTALADDEIEQVADYYLLP